MHVEPASPPPVTQTPPLWQMLPAQQAMFSAPHIMQMLGPVPGGFAQASPEPHMLFAQHCWLLPPHGSHDCVVPPSAAVWQDNPVPQVFAAPPPQQAWPMPPHAWHIAGVVVPGGFTHAAPVLHVPLPPPPGQHGWPGAPHAAQLVPPSAPATQAPPLWQMSPGQQAMPTSAARSCRRWGRSAGFAQPRPVLQTLPAAAILAVAAAGLAGHAAIAGLAGMARRCTVFAAAAAAAALAGTAARLAHHRPRRPCRAPCRSCRRRHRRSTSAWPRRTFPHEPFMHMPDVPLPVQVVPAPMQLPPTQQPPLLHVFAAQQFWPGPPQVVAAPPVPPVAPAAPPRPPAPARPPAPGDAARAAPRADTAGMRARGQLVPLDAAR